MTETNHNPETQVSQDNIDNVAVEHEIQIDEHQEISHESTLFAEPIFNLGNFTITNSLLNSWIAIFIIIVLSFIIKIKLKKIPGKLQSYVEVIIDGTLNLADSVTGSREKSLKFLPVVFPLFIFILLNNWLGLLPGVGSIGYIAAEHGELVFVPFLRGATADLNTTLALSIFAVIATHIFSVFTTSFWKYLNRFIGIDLITVIPRKIFKEKDYSALLVHPIKFFVGIVEIVGELAKVASLSFRLFGNIFAGEVLMGAMAAIFAYALPIPFMFLELIVGIIQALIFAMLTLVFLTVLTTDHDEHEEQPTH
ncbi:MAG: F0F1 ATP synthase subunit A [Candidatus Buchananbacteria bacterium]|nr:F0F1 ATP synthase subunit A [Candidatus Buchananbacteria bacterium]